jgi:virginiamycin B lyase
MAVSQPIRLFISYSRSDSAFVDTLEAHLRYGGYQTWVDRRKIEAGQIWNAEIREAIDRCQVTLLILSPTALASPWVQQEIRYAQSQKKPIIPIYCLSCPAVPKNISRFQLLDFRDIPTPALSPEKYQKQIALLSQAIGIAVSRPTRKDTIFEVNRKNLFARLTAIFSLPVALAVIAAIVICVILSVGIVNLVQHFNPGPLTISYTTAIYGIGGGGRPYDLTSGPNGTIWFTEDQDNRIGSCCSQQGPVITEYTNNRPNTEPTELLLGPDNQTLWVTEPGINAIAYFDAQSQSYSNTFSIPVADAQPYGIVSSHGKYWVTLKKANAIFVFQPEGAAPYGVGTKVDYSVLPITTPQSEPTRITATVDGTIWFVESGANQIGEITPAGKLQEFSIPTANANPTDIAVDAHGNAWFTEQTGLVGEVTPTGTITERKAPDTRAKLTGITIGPDKNIWFAEQDAHTVVVMAPSGKIVHQIVLQSSALPTHLINGSDGNVWFTDYEGGEGGMIGKVIPSGTLTF